MVVNEACFFVGAADGDEVTAEELFFAVAVGKGIVGGEDGPFWAFGCGFPPGQECIPDEADAENNFGFVFGAE